MPMNLVMMHAWIFLLWNNWSLFESDRMKITLSWTQLLFIYYHFNDENFTIEYVSWMMDEHVDLKHTHSCNFTTFLSNWFLLAISILIHTWFSLSYFSRHLRQPWQWSVYPFRPMRNRYPPNENVPIIREQHQIYQMHHQCANPSLHLHIKHGQSGVWKLQNWQHWLRGILQPNHNWYFESRRFHCFEYLQTRSSFSYQSNGVDKLRSSIAATWCTQWISG